VAGDILCQSEISPVKIIRKFIHLFNIISK
jgi:hypothetical protein